MVRQTHHQLQSLEFQILESFDLIIKICIHIREKMINQSCPTHKKSNHMILLQKSLGKLNQQTPSFKFYNIWSYQQLQQETVYESPDNLPHLKQLVDSFRRNLNTAQISLKKIENDELTKEKMAFYRKQIEQHNQLLQKMNMLVYNSQLYQIVFSQMDPKEKQRKHQLKLIVQKKLEKEMIFILEEKVPEYVLLKKNIDKHIFSALNKDQKTHAILALLRDIKDVLGQKMKDCKGQEFKGYRNKFNYDIKQLIDFIQGEAKILVSQEIKSEFEKLFE